MADQDDPQVFLKKRELASILKITTNTLDNWRRRGIIPEPVKFGERTLRWPS
jgi:predicted DNA-binding transcriptional regulator AlpA